jgi:hypothetical protein
MTTINVSNHAVSFEVETKFGDRLEQALNRHIRERDGVDRDHAAPHELTDKLWDALSEALELSDISCGAAGTCLHGHLIFTVDVESETNISDVLSICERVVIEWAKDLDVDNWKDLQ